MSTQAAARANANAAGASSAERQALDFIVRASWDDLPADVRERAFFCLIDDLGAVISGLPTKAAAIAARCAPRIWGGEEATILLDGLRASMAGAAFANATAANGTDVDDCGVFTWGHPGALVLPTALAVAERERASGRDLLTAMVVGYETAFRVGRCMHDAEAYYRACGSWGAVACAAVTANLLGLTGEQVHHALGIAEYHAPDAPMWRDVAHPAMVKHAIGWGAATGVTSALLASEGFTGIPTIAADERYAAWIEGIGEDFLITSGITWKRHSSCAWTHPAVTALQHLLRREPFAVEDVARVEVIAYRDACRLGMSLPNTSEEAQFNLAWAVAAYLVDGEIAPVHMLESRLGDARLRAVASLVTCSESAEFTRLYKLCEVNDPAGAELAQVVVDLRDGRRLDSGPVRFELYPAGGWSRDEMEAKFCWLVRPHVSDGSVDRLLERLWRLDQLEDVRELVRDLRRDLDPHASEHRDDS